MKKKIGKLSLVLTFVASLSLAATDAGIQQTAAPDVMDDKVDVLLGAGFAFSPGYGDYMDETYADYTGLAGWIDLYLGVDYKITPQLSVFGGADFWFNAVEEVFGDSYMNTVITPSVYVQYYFTPARTFYVNGGIGLPIPSTGRDGVDWSANGVTLGGNVGYAVGEGTVRFEVGYLMVPVTAEAPGTSFSEDYDFGGVMLRFLFGF